MIEPINIVSIEGRSPEGDGVSRPFRCLDSNDQLYYLKLKNVGHDHLVKEWVCGRLARKMGLKCAEIFQANVPRILVAGNKEYESELGHGIAFASRLVANSVPLASEHIRFGNGNDLSKILMFDWWTRNSDRSLGEFGGNPNLLWTMDAEAVVMIDHDNSFDESFNPSDFWQSHALRNHTQAWHPDERSTVSAWLETGLSHLDEIWSELPEEWFFNEFGDPRSGLSKSGLHDVLNYPWTRPDEFWASPSPPASP